MTVNINDNQLPLDIIFTISVIDDAFCFAGNLKSNSGEWSFKELDYPKFSAIRINDGSANVNWPSGLGQHLSDPEHFGSRSLNYPSREGSMDMYILSPG